MMWLVIGDDDDDGDSDDDDDDEDDDEHDADEDDGDDDDDADDDYDFSISPIRRSDAIQCHWSMHHHQEIEELPEKACLRQLLEKRPLSYWRISFIHHR